MGTQIEKSVYSQHFENLSPEYIKRATAELERPFEKLRTIRDLTILRKYLKPGKLLDFPIGTGRVYPELLDEFEVYGKDIASSYVEHARKNFPELSDRFSTGSFEEPDGEAEFFDSIYSLRVLNNVQNLELAVSNTAKLLKPGGVWIFNLPPGRVTIDLLSCLDKNNLKLRRRIAYDWVSSVKDMGQGEARLRSCFIKLIKKGIVPFFIYKLVDSLMPRKGLVMLVVEKK